MFTIATAADGSPFLEVADRPGLLLPRVAIRPLTPHDTAPQRAVFDGMSSHSRRMRFLAPVPALSDVMQQRLSDVDHDGHGCWVATVGEEVAGLGRYIRLPAEPQTAEVAFEVVDRYQGRGLGRLLLEVVGAAAGDAGVTGLLWVMDPANTRVRHLAVPLGGLFTQEYDALEGTTPLPDVDCLDAARVARVATSARRRAVLRRAA